MSAMKRRSTHSALAMVFALCITLGVALAAGTGSAVPSDAPEQDKQAAAQDTDLVAVVQGIYAHFTGEAEPMGDFEILRPLATPELVALMDRETACMEGDGPGCNYWASAIVDGQDCDLANLAVAETLTEPERREVTASFTNFGEPRLLVYDFVLLDGRWLLRDISSREEYPWSLVETLSQ